MNTYFIHEDNMPRLEKKLLTIQRKCQKYGCDFDYERVGEVFKGYDNCNDLTSDMTKVKANSPVIRFIEVAVLGTARVGDWQFVGTIEHHDPMNIISLYLTDVKLPEVYYTSNPECDHCNIRRARKNTYIVQNVESGELKQVGGSCMKEYTKGLSAEAAVAWISIFDELIQMEAPDGEGYRKYFKVEEVLSTAVSIIDVFGFVKTRNVYDEYNQDCTRDNVLQFINQDEYFLKRLYNDYSNFVNPENNKEYAKLVREWVLSQEEDYGYLTNLMVTLREDWCEYKHIGLIVSAVQTYRREIEKLTYEKKIKEEHPESHHIGSIGERLTFKVNEIVCLTSYYTEYGLNYFYRIVDGDGNIYVWSTSKCLDGDYTTVIGTVKKHDEYNGEKQTVLTRCKIA